MAKSTAVPTYFVLVAAEFGARAAAATVLAFGPGLLTCRRRDGGDHTDRRIQPALTFAGRRGTWIFPATEFITPSQHIDAQIASALQNHQPVMLSTSLMGGPLADQHVYSIEGITGTGSDAMVTLRNPWGADDGDAVIKLPLGEIIGSGIPGLGPAGMINVGRMGS